MNPLISVVVPVYNVEKTIVRCVESILNQTFTNWELILVDDGSIDHSGIICDEYALKDNRVLVFHKENGGVSSARNMGLDKAIGKYITFVDSDDWIEKEFLEKLLSNVCPDTDCIIGAMSDEDILILEKDKFLYLKRMFISGFTTVWNKIFDRKFIESNNLRFEPIRYSEDFIFFVKAICMAKQIKYIKDALYHYDRTNETSALHNCPKDMYKDLLYCDRLMINFFYDQGILNELIPEMYWRVLRNKKELVLSVNLHDEFKQVIPEANDYILSCPIINKKIKFMMWLLSIQCDSLVRTIIFLRKFLGR